jgi:sugar/nucleoside kinase (ribokinase family)
MPSAIVAGHVCVDLIPQLEALPDIGPGELAEVGPLTAAAGGCVANTGGVLAALGADVAAAGDAGDDELGALLTTMLGARGVDTAQVRRRPGETTSYSLVVQAPGRDRSFWHHVGANARFDGASVDLAGIDLLHVGYPSLLPALTASGGEALAALLERARAQGATTSLDLAVIDPASAAARLDWGGLLERLMPLVDIVSPSVEDLRSGPGLDGELPALARRLVDMGAAVVLVTASADGLALCTGDAERLRRAGPLLARAAERWCDEALAIPAIEVEVRSTLAAGDAASGGLLWGVLDGRGPHESLRLAAEVAAAQVAGAPIGTQRPEEPNPASPRPSALGGSSSTVSTGGVRHGTSTSWAIRSPGRPL